MYNTTHHQWLETLRPATCLQNRLLRLLRLAVGSCFALKISLTAISSQIKSLLHVVPTAFLTCIHSVFHAHICMCERSDGADRRGPPTWENLCRTSCMTKHFVEIVHSPAMVAAGWSLCGIY